MNVNALKVHEAFSKKRYSSSKTKIFQERALVFPFFRLSHPLSQHLEAKGLQIEVFFLILPHKRKYFFQKIKIFFFLKINTFSWRRSQFFRNFLNFTEYFFLMEFFFLLILFVHISFYRAGISLVLKIHFCFQ